MPFILIFEHAMQVKTEHVAYRGRNIRPAFRREVVK